MIVYLKMTALIDSDGTFDMISCRVSLHILVCGMVI